MLWLLIWCIIPHAAPFPELKGQKMPALAESFLLKIDPSRFDIWRYASLYSPPVEEGYRLTLGEGWTKEVESRGITSTLALESLLFKREDLNPVGSHKARSLAYQVSRAWAEGRRELVISSSGNAAVAAAAYCRLAGIRLYAFVPLQVAPFKLAQLRRFGAEVIVTGQAINAAKRAARRYGLLNLRPSTDDRSIEGFKSIACELYEKVGLVDALFTFVTSASSLIGIGRAFRTLRDELKALERLPALHAVQAGRITSIAGKFDQMGRPSRERSLVGDLGVKRTRRTEEAVSLIEESGGGGWIVSDEDIRRAIALLNQHGLDTSLEGGAALAGVMKATQRRALGKVVCLLTGHASQRPQEEWETAVKPLNDRAEIEYFLDGIRA